MKTVDRSVAVNRMRMLLTATFSAVAVVAGLLAAYGMLLGWDNMGWLIFGIVYIVLTVTGPILSGYLNVSTLWDHVRDSDPDISSCLLLAAIITTCAVFTIAAVVIGILTALPEGTYMIGPEWYLPVLFVGLPWTVIALMSEFA